MSVSKPKILYVASTFSHLASFHQPYMAWFAEQGFEVHAAAGQEVRPFKGVSRSVSLPFEKRMFSPRNLSAAAALRRLMRQERYDLISLHTSLAAFFTRLACLGGGAQGACVMNTVHGYLFDAQSPPLKRGLLLGAEKLTAPVTDYLLTMNQQDYAIATQHHLGRQIIQTDGMGIDLDRFHPPSPDERLRARQSLGLPPDALVLVYAAEFSTRKNQSMLLRALPHLPENVHLLLPGRGDLLDACRQLAAQLGVADRVQLPGFVSDVPRCYQAADVCVSASRSEGLPFHLVEAMRCGLPIAATAVKGHEDLLTAESGILFPFDDQTAFIQAVQRLHDPGLRAQMGAAAYARAEQFGLDRVFPALTRIYAAALHSRTDGSSSGGTT